MSSEWTDRVWAHSKQKGSAKLLLLAVAQVADEQGSTTALSMPSLEHLVGTKERNIQLLLTKLEQSNELRREFGVGHYGRTRYILLHPPVTIDAAQHQAAPLQPATPAAHDLAPVAQPHAATTQSPAPEPQLVTPDQDVVDCTRLRKEGVKEGEIPARKSEPAAGTPTPGTPPPTPDGQPSLSDHPLRFWQTVRITIGSADHHQLHLLATEHDNPTGGFGHYWLGRAILAAVATDATFATNPRALNLVRAILRRWQRERSYGSDTKAYQQQAERAPAAARPVAAPSAPVAPSQPTDRAVWRTATTAQASTTSPAFRISALD